MTDFNSFKPKFPKDVHPRPHLMIFWFHFLRISASYQLATRFRAGELSELDKQRLPVDFDDVLKTYDDFGDVWSSDYHIWTRNKWRELFDANVVMPQAKTLGLLSEGQIECNDQLETNLKLYFEQYRPTIGYPMTIIMTLPIVGNKKRMMSEVELILDRYEGFIKNSPPVRPVAKPKYALLINKVRDRVIKLSHQIIITKANYPDYKMWQIAIRLKLNPIQTEKINAFEQQKAAAKAQGKKVDGLFEPVEEKLLINAVMGRYIRHAYLLAENAARGKFPCIDERYDEHGKKEKTFFDYPAILEGLKEESIRRMQIDN
jgi:hypothetical protein